MKSTNAQKSNDKSKNLQNMKNMKALIPKSARMPSEPSAMKDASPRIDQRGPEIQKYGTRLPLPLGLPNETCVASIEALNQVLADTMSLRDLYKKHHWQVAGPTFYELHLLFDKHYEEQHALIDLVAERIQALGGISLAMAADVAEMTRIERPPRGREAVAVQLSRLLTAHEIILKEVREFARKAADQGDDGTNDLLVSNVLRTNEMQVWFLAEHLVPEALTQSESIDPDDVQ